MISTEYISLYKLFKKRKEFGIDWIDSFQTLRKWVVLDKKKHNF